MSPPGTRRPCGIGQRDSLLPEALQTASERPPVKPGCLRPRLAFEPDFEDVGDLIEAVGILAEIALIVHLNDALYLWTDRPASAPTWFSRLSISVALIPATSPRRANAHTCGGDEPANSGCQGTARGADRGASELRSQGSAPDRGRPRDCGGQRSLRDRAARSR